VDAVTVTLTRPTPESVAALPEVLELVEDADNEWRVTAEDVDHYVITELIWHGNDQGLFGSHDVSFWTTADGDGISDGGLITVDLGRYWSAPRLCSLHTEVRDLIDRDAEGRELAAQLLTSVKRTVDELLANLGRYARGGE
jgi:hypothetical protein